MKLSDLSKANSLTKRWNSLEKAIESIKVSQRVTMYYIDQGCTCNVELDNKKSTDIIISGLQAEIEECKKELIKLGVEV